MIIRTPDFYLSVTIQFLTFDSRKSDSLNSTFALRLALIKFLRTTIVLTSNCVLRLVLAKYSWSSPQTISNSQLHVLPHFHLCPIYLVLFKGFYSFKRMGYLILGGTSRLDAFSVYSFRTWLPGDAIGMTAGTPVVRPARSSRTKASSPQISYARAG